MFMSKQQKQKYWDALDKAEEIVKKLGKKMYDEGYYSDRYYGQKYTYEDLTIIIYDATPKVHLYINIGDENMLYWDSENSKITFETDVDWLPLIDALYREMPSIISQREAEQRYKESKEGKLKALEPYFKNCIKLYKADNTLTTLNRILKRDDLKIVRSKSYWTPSSVGLIAEYDEPREDYSGMFTIYHNGSPVAQFKGNEFDVLPGMYYYVQHFSPGYWIDSFKDAVDEAMEDNERLTNQRTNNSINNMMRRLKK